MIIPVKKVKIFTLEEHKEELLIALQSNELMMINNKLESGSIDSKFEDDLIIRSEAVLKRLSDYQKKKDFFEYQTLNFDDFVLDDIKRYDLLDSIEADFELMDRLVNSNISLNEKLTLIEPFKDFPYVLDDLSKSIYVSFHVGYIPDKELEVFTSYLKESKIEHETFELSKYGYPVVFVLDKDEEDKYLNEIKSLKYIPAKLPTLTKKVKEELELINNEIKENTSKIESLKEDFGNSKVNEIEIKVLVDQLRAKKERKSVPILSTKETIYVEGWVREDKIKDLESSIKLVTNVYDIDISEPLEEDLVPTALQNNKFVSQFEVITNMFSAPNRKEVDPNPAMSVWYWLIFGIMMGDIGYGLLMVVLFGLFIKLKKPKGSLSKLTHVLYYSGYTSIAAGVVFGSLFGFNFGVIEFLGKIFGQSWSSFSPIDDPLTMLVFSIGLGIAHIITALTLKVILSIKQKDVLTALADGVSWISILAGASVAIVGMMVIKSNMILYLGLAFVAIGVLLILTLAGRDKKGIFGKITSGLGGLYNSTSYLSDLLSYSRILALTLSSAVIASTMNLLAGLVQGSFVGIIFSIIIYIVGHTFNFAMGLLSAYVHDSRLQYIEFYNKFYEGGGIEFAPLTFNNEYIKEITN